MMTIERSNLHYKNHELQILDAIQTMRTLLLDKIMVNITKLGDGGVVWITLDVVLLMMKQTRREGMLLACSLIIEALICNLLLKPLIARTRPCDVNPTISLLIKRPKDYSFPSGHTAASFVSVTIFYLCRSILWKPALLIACMIAFSRMYLYVHYPSDIIAGMVIGICVSYLVFLHFGM